MDCGFKGKVGVAGEGEIGVNPRTVTLSRTNWIYGELVLFSDALQLETAEGSTKLAINTIRSILRKNVRNNDHICLSAL
jgi:hypothetical protein